MDATRAPDYRTSDEARQALQALLEERLFTGNPTPRVLEAGGGSSVNIKLPDEAHVVGVDISAEELDKNPRLSERIVADIETIDYQPAAYDLVVCWDVLEHLDNPAAALDRFVPALAPSGMLVLAFPNLRSLKAKVTRYSPHWFHVLVYRIVYGPRYGSRGLITFPTTLRPAIAPDRLLSWASAMGLELVFESHHESGVHRRFRKKFWVSLPLAQFLDKALRTVSLGKLALLDTDCMLLLQAPPKATAGVEATP